MKMVSFRVVVITVAERAWDVRCDRKGFVRKAT
jgi:hypothetical protein